MRLIFIGPPGSGKGTQAQRLSKNLALEHFSTGDILREAIVHETLEGKKAKSYMTNGQLVPDDIVNEIVSARVRSMPKPQRLILDGYPRTLPQAVLFDALLQDQGLRLDAVVYLKVPDEEIVRRNSARWTCINPDCKATYNTITKPPKTPGRCDLCQQLLAQREDDKPETIRRRLQVFHEKQHDILEYYRKKGLLIEVPGSGDIEAIYANIEKALKQKTSA
jgi:adenylate kinase